VSERVRIRSVNGCSAGELEGLARVLIDCVLGGASVSFMPPLSLERAVDFWRGVCASAARGERVLLVAEADGEVLGTVQLLLAMPENQPHRAEIAKMLVHGSARRRGVGAALLAAAEDAARTAHRTLLTLDTASGAAERLYTRGGWQRCGRIPGYALLPDGRPCDTTIFFKALQPRSDV
jgi:GNAT superfamily N-acetyltransferase